MIPSTPALGGAKLTSAIRNVQIALRRVLLTTVPAWGADPFHLLDRACQTRMFGIGQVKLVPLDAVSMNPSGPRDAKMADGERFNQRRRPKAEFRDNVVVALAFGSQFLDAAEDAAVVSAHLAPDQQFDAALSLSFRHDGPPGFLQ
jgi:hypothetical protein